MDWKIALELFVRALAMLICVALIGFSLFVFFAILGGELSFLGWLRLLVVVLCFVAAAAGITGMILASH